MFTRLLRWCFFTLIVRPLILIIIGLNIRHWERLPCKGPAIIVANHNSHLDTLVLMSLFPLAQLPYLHPVAAADYFLRNRFLAWFALNLIGILPLERTRPREGTETLQGIYQALDQGHILILFPEGTRGEPERLSKFKNGIARLAQTRPDVPVIPIFLHGLGKSLPKGEILLVPFFCDIFVGDALPWTGDKANYMQHLDDVMRGLAEEGQFASWE